MGTWKFDKSGTFTWPPNVFAVRVDAFSGGGGGGNTNDTLTEPDEETGDQFIDAAGGGGAGTAVITHLIRKSAATMAVTIGEGGDEGEDGGDTLIIQDGVTEVSLPGGSAASGATGGASGNSPYGDGGTSTQTGGAGGGALDLLGTDTDEGRGQPNIGDVGGLGGVGSGFGAGQGGDGGRSNDPGVDGQAYGAGGGGHGRTNVAIWGYPLSGKGGNGVAVFTWQTGAKSQRFVPGRCCRDINCEDLRECLQVTPHPDNTSVVDLEIVIDGFSQLPSPYDSSCCDSIDNTYLVPPPFTGGDFSVTSFFNPPPDSGCWLTRPIVGADACKEPLAPHPHIFIGNTSLADTTDSSWICVIRNYRNRGVPLGYQASWQFGYFGADAKAAITQLCNTGKILLPPVSTWPGHEGAGFELYNPPPGECETASAYATVEIIPP